MDALDPLDAAILDALRPRSGRERVRAVLARGWTVMQVYERLPGAERAAVDGRLADPTAAARRGIDQVHRRLLELVRIGRVKKRRESYSMFLNTKGERGMLVDLYRLA